MSKKGNSKFSEVFSWNVILKTNEQTFTQKLNALRRMIKIWHADQVEAYHQELNIKSILIHYATYMTDFNDKDCLQKHLYIKPILYDEQLKTVKTQRQIYLGFEFIQRKTWKINFSQVLIEQLYSMSQVIIKKMFLLLYIYAQGYLPFNGTQDICLRAVERHSNSQLKYFVTSVEDEDQSFFLLLNIGVQKIPIFDFQNGSLTSFEFLHFIECEELLISQTVQNQKKLENIIDKIEIINEFNPKMSYSQKELIIQQQKLNPKITYYGAKKYKESSYDIGLTLPVPYHHLKADKIEIENLDFMIKRFKFHQSKDYHILLNQEELMIQRSKSTEQSQIARQQRNLQKFAQEIALKQKLQFRHAAKIIQILEQIPNFKYKLTNQQREVLLLNGNLVVVGRSGTGKTTCAMLRLYGIEYISKKREINRILADKTKITNKCQLVIFQELQLSKNMFLTFSPVLIDEIKKQYDDMIYQIKEKHTEKCQSCKLTFVKRKTYNHNEQDPIDRIRRLEAEQENKVTSLNQISKRDFPAFFTIENFLKMIDKTIVRPFFDHQLEKNRKKNNSQIKHAFINRYNYLEEDFGRDKSIEAVFVQYNFFLSHIWPNVPKDLSKTSKQFNLVTPSVVWSEIFSIIKGSINSYTCPERFISLKMYLNEKRNVFQNYEDEQVIEIKTRVYNIFKIYHNWCKSENGYDLMDVVNHLLQETQFFGYNGPKMNYMFIDEVQDLTSATTFLLSKMVLNNIFYCGDTAQAITKGIDFRFDDIKYIFNKQYCKNAIDLEPPSDPINLTVNFRSHNLILQMANSVIASIEEIFPKAISKMKNRKEQSDLFGPRPNIILKRLDLLFELICGPKEMLQNETALNENEQKMVNEIKIIQVKQKHEQQHQIIENQIKNQDEQNEETQEMMDGQNDQEQQICEDQYEEEEITQTDVKQQKQNGYNQKNQTRKFNCEQIIIVRNEEEKKKLPLSLQAGLVLTPQTAKGLQFDEIILYNFFGSCGCFEKWKILDYLEVEITYQDQKEFEDKLSRRNKEETGVVQEMTIILKSLLDYDLQKKQYRVRTIKHKPNINQLNLNNYFELVTELKLLYTIITRARSVFVIYDTKIPQSLIRLWEKMNLTTFISDENIVKCRKDIQTYTKRQRHVKYLNENQLWMNQGSVMLSRKQYNEAKTCFMRIKKIDIVERIQAIQLENWADNQLYRINNESKKLDQLERVQRKIKKVKLEKEKKEVLAVYLKAGNILMKYVRFNQAGNLFYKGQDYNQALHCYRAILDEQKIADCCYKLKRYQEAAEIYEKKHDTQKLVECYTQSKNWEKLSNIFNENTQTVEILSIKEQNIHKSLQNLLRNCTENEEIHQKKKNFRYFYQKQIQQNKSNKSKFILKQIETQIQKIDKESIYWNTKKLFQTLLKKQFIYEKIISQLNFLQQLKKELNKQKMIKLTQLETINNIIAVIFKQYETILKKRSEIEFLYPSDEELQANVQYMDLFKIQMDLRNQLNIRNKDKKDIQIRLNQIMLEIDINFEKLQKKQLIFGQIANTCNIVKVKEALKTIRKRLEIIIDQYIKLNKKNKRKPITQQKQIQEQSDLNLNLKYMKSQDYSNIDDDMMQISDIASMKQLWQEEKNNIVGLNLYPADKEEIFNQIEKTINTFYPKMIEDKIENSESKYHHNYIQQKIKFALKDKGAQQILKLLNRCDNAESINSCLLICDYYPELIALALKYILMYSLQSSDNFTFKRQIKKEQNSNENQIQQNMEKIEQFVVNLNNKALLHRIPKLALGDKFYSSSIINEFVPGLILQGYYKQALLFCDSASACKLTYLFSSYQLMVDQIKKIAEKKSIRLPDIVYLFTTELLNNEKISQAKSINIFSIENIFYAYDQCQEEPFLSKKPIIDEIDIDEETIEQIVNYGVNSRIEKLKEYKAQLLEQNSFLSQSIFQYKKLLTKDLVSLEDQARMFDELIKKKKDQAKQKNQEKKQLQQLMEDFSIQKSVAMKNKINAKLSRKIKLEKEGQIAALLFAKKDEQTKKNDKKVKQLQAQKQDLVYKYAEDRNKQALAEQQYQIISKRYSQIQSQIKKINIQLSSIHKKIQNYQLKIQSVKTADIKEWYFSQIKLMETQIKENNKKLPQILNIKNEQEMKNVLQRKLIQQEQYKRHKKQRDQLIVKIKKQILKKSNIPKDSKFLKYYLDDQLSFKNQDRRVDQKLIAEIYYKILNNGIKLQQFQAKQDGKQTICNIVIFYLSLIFNKSFREDIIDFKNNVEVLYQQSKTKQQQILRQIKKIQTKLQYCQFQIEKIAPGKRHINNWDYNDYFNSKNNCQSDMNAAKLQLYQVSKFKKSPKVLIHNFLQNIYKRLKQLDHSNIRFMQILFGFFQCRIIQDCPLLDFLANEYVLVRSNSVIISKMKQTNVKFCYYFDQERTTVLCLFEDVQKVILNLLQKQHRQVYLIMPDLEKFVIKNVDKKKYLDKKVIGFSKKEQDKDGLSFKLLACNTYEQKKRIENLYNNQFLQNSLLSKIKPIKRELLSFYFENQFIEKESFFFIFHQIRELHFIEKMCIQTTTFNADLLLQMKNKFEGLEQQFKKWMPVARKDHIKSK